jgi:beta-glucanase (GH16 family)
VPSSADGTASADLYLHAQHGVTRWDARVPDAGTYAVLVGTGTPKDGPSPSFDITAEGRPVASLTASPDRPSHAFALVRVDDGTLSLGFRPNRGPAAVSTLEVSKVAGPAGRTQRFGDNFSGPAGQPASTKHWTAQTGGEWGDGEVQSYTERPANASLDGAGNLLITALRQPYRGEDGVARDHTSARLDTEGKYTFRYGRIEARLRMPAGAGLHPAFWALGANLPKVGWPRCGEIDVIELIGSEPATAHGTIHAADSSGADESRGHEYHAERSMADAFHTYAADWSPIAIVHSVDETIYGVTPMVDLPRSMSTAFEQPFFLVLNLAVGGRWAGNPPATTTFPAKLAVDHVRVLQ